MKILKTGRRCFHRTRAKKETTCWSHQLSVALRDCTLYFSDDEDSEDWQKMLPQDLDSSIIKAEIVIKTEREEEPGGWDPQVSAGEGLLNTGTGHGTVNAVKEEGADLPGLHNAQLGEERSHGRGNCLGPGDSDHRCEIPAGKSSLCRNGGTEIKGNHENLTMHRACDRDECGDGLKREENLPAHKETMHAEKQPNLQTLTPGERPYICENCGITFTSNEPLTKLPSIQSAELSLCPNCGSTCFEKQQTLGDQTADVVWNPHTCTECEKSFQNDDDLMEHHAFHLENPYWCGECERTFRSHQGLKVHRNLLHTGKTPLMCSKCGKFFMKHNELLAHRKSHRKQNKKPSMPLLKRTHVGKDSHLCTVCDRGFSCASALMTHVRSHTGERPYTCKECGKSFLRGHHLMKHTRTHKAESPYQCLYCNKVFTEHDSCMRHQNLHLGKGHPCTSCGLSFSSGFSLRRHERMHSVEKAHRCTECDKEFSNKYAFIMHQSVHLGQGPYKCGQCEASFRLKSAFLEHMFGHSSEHLYTCIACKKSFNKLEMLYEHQRLHTGEKPFTCNVCHQAFRRKSYFTMHLKKHAGQRTLLQEKTPLVDLSL